MKNKKNVSIKKIVMLLIVILIPLLASTLIGVYGYNRYKDLYFDEYMNEVEEVTIDKAHALLQYTSVRYEKEPMYVSDVKRNDKDVFRIEMFRVISREEITNEDGTTTFKEQLQYHFAIYNINYAQLVAIKDPTGEERLEYNNIPTVHMRVTDREDTDQVKAFSLGVPQDKDGNALFIYDYDSTPEKDYKGRELTSRFLRWLIFVPGEDFSSSLKIDFVVSDKPLDESNATYHGLITSFTLDNMVDNQTDIDTSSFAVGYNNSIKNAGYFWFIFKSKLWWQSAVALVAVGFIMASFYLVWMAEVQNQTVEKTKKKK